MPTFTLHGNLVHFAAFARHIGFYPAPRGIEAFQLIRAMWADAPANFQGDYYRVTNAYCEPRPNPAPPIMVGGAGEQYLLRVVAEHAD